MAHTILLFCVACQDPDFGTGPVTLSPGVQASFEEYRSLDAPIYFAVSESGRGSYYVYCEGGFNCTYPAAQMAVLDGCRRNNPGEACKIYAVRRSVVWRDADGSRAAQAKLSAGDRLVRECLDGATPQTRIDRCSEAIASSELAQEEKRGPHYVRARAYEQIGDLALAEQDYRAALRIDPAHVEARSRLARLHSSAAPSSQPPPSTEAASNIPSAAPEVAPKPPAATIAAVEQPLDLKPPPSSPVALKVTDPFADFRREPRRALVIGNAAYDVKPLGTPLRDARDVAAALEKVGFRVRLGLNLDRDEFLGAVSAFGEELGQNGVGLFYYGGHGVQVDGENYLIPVRAEIRNEEMLQSETVELNRVLARMGGNRSRLNIVILDACREDPFAGSFRTLSRGLAPLKLAPSGTFIAYATAPGKVASDGLPGGNSPFAGAFLAALQEPGLRIEDVFKRVLRDVRTQTQGSQEPWYHSSILGDFYFNLPQPPGIVAVDYGGRDSEAWDRIKRTSDSLDLELFLEVYPESPLAPLARTRLRRLGVSG